MKIFHTSDLHLSEKKKGTIHTLENILEIAKSIGVDLVTIGGDFFDSDRDAEVLRPKLRELFQGNNFRIIVIAGNHDSQSFSGDLDFGSDIKVAIDEPFEIIPFEDVTIVALPYREKPDEQLLHDLKNAADISGTKVLLLHCTLDIGFLKHGAGEEESRSYFPITRDTLSRLGYDYILAGHFHSPRSRLALDGGCTFLYPGSPISHSKKEIGKRYAYLIDTSEKSIESIPLNTFYYDHLPINVIPGQEKGAIKEIQDWVHSRSNDECELDIEIKGFIQIPEMEFRDALGIFEDNVSIHPQYKDVRNVLEYPLYRRFKEKILTDESIENVQDLDVLVLDTITQLLAGRRLRT